MNVRINKDIREYKEKVFFGLTIRQTIGVFIGLIVSVLVFFRVRHVVGIDVAVWICMLVMVPFVAAALVTYNGMSLYELTITWLRFYLLMPIHLTFGSLNFYQEVAKESALQEQTNQRKMKNHKKHEEGSVIPDELDAEQEEGTESD